LLRKSATQPDQIDSSSGGPDLLRHPTTNSCFCHTLARSSDASHYDYSHRELKRGTLSGILR
jgi:hypothetical protein